MIETMEIMLRKVEYMEQLRQASAQCLQNLKLEAPDIDMLIRVHERMKALSEDMQREIMT